MALLSLPALVVTYFYDRRRLGRTQQSPKPGETSPYTLLVVRLLPFYLWLSIFTAQGHKEERFIFPAYPLLCFNSAVTIYLVKGWLETVYIHITKSPYEAGRTSIFSRFSLMAVLVPGIISISRIIGIYVFYHAPFDVLHHFQYSTIPEILLERGYEPLPLPKDYQPYNGEIPAPKWDMAPLQELDPAITLCYGTEWHRLPGSYLVPEGIDIQWLPTNFDGMMPRKWEKSASSGSIWPRNETTAVRLGRFNGNNKASLEPGTYVSLRTAWTIQ